MRCAIELYMASTSVINNKSRLFISYFFSVDEYMKYMVGIFCKWISIAIITLAASRENLMYSNLTTD